MGKLYLVQIVGHVTSTYHPNKVYLKSCLSWLHYCEQWERKSSLCTQSESPQLKNSLLLCTEHFSTFLLRCGNKTTIIATADSQNYHLLYNSEWRDTPFLIANYHCHSKPLIKYEAGNKHTFFPVHPSTYWNNSIVG